MNKTSISIFKIIVTLCAFASIPFIAQLVDLVVNNETLSFTATLHTVNFIIVMLNYNTVEIHVTRVKENFNDFLIFTLIGLVILFGLFYCNEQWFHAGILMPNFDNLVGYELFIPLIYLAYSYAFSSCFVFTFKCFTDRFQVKSNELVIILVSGFSYGLLVSLLMVALTSTSLALNFIFYFIVSTLSAYTYNQSRSLIPMMIAYGTVLFITMLF